VAEFLERERLAIAQHVLESRAESGLRELAPRA
jgi:hypothetical protein